MCLIKSIAQERMINNSLTQIFVAFHRRIGRKKSLVYFMILASIASVGAVLFTMYDPGNDKCKSLFPKLPYYLPILGIKLWISDSLS